MVHKNKVILKANEMEGMTSKEHFIQNKIEMAGEKADHSKDFKTLAEIQSRKRQKLRKFKSNENSNKIVADMATRDANPSTLTDLKTADRAGTCDKNSIRQVAGVNYEKVSDLSLKPDLEIFKNV